MTDNLSESALASISNHSVTDLSGNGDPKSGRVLELVRIGRPRFGNEQKGIEKRGGITPALLIDAPVFTAVLESVRQTGANHSQSWQMTPPPLESIYFQKHNTHRRFDNAQSNRTVRYGAAHGREWAVQAEPMCPYTIETWLTMAYRSIDLSICRSVRMQLIEILSIIISQISQCLVMARSQSLASLRTTPLNDEATGFCTHPFPEAMRFSTTTVVRLECSLHKLTLLKVFAE